MRSHYEVHEWRHAIAILRGDFPREWQDIIEILTGFRLLKSFDRDLNNFRLLFDLRVISVGVIITRCDELQDIFNKLGRGPSYGASTTHLSKLLPKVWGGSSGGCPLLVFGITKHLFIDDGGIS